MHECHQLVCYPEHTPPKSEKRLASHTSMPVENKMNTHKTHSYTLTHVR